MWPFSKQVKYSANAAPFTMQPSSSGKICINLGGTPDYVPPPGTGGGGTPSPAIKVDIGCPALDSMGPSQADGPTVAVLAPAGATKYRVWFSPARALTM